VPAGTYKLRAVASGYTRSGWKRVQVADADASCDVVLSQVVGSVSPTEIDAELLTGMQLPVDLTITNTGNATWLSTAYKLTPLKVLLLSDYGSLNALSGLITNMGAQCTVRGDNVASGISQAVANLVSYDIVIADFAGPDGNGRPLDYEEGDALYTYVKGGGRLILTGVIPLTSADHFLLDWLFEVETDGVQAVAARQGLIAGGADLLNGPFGSLDLGAYLPVTDQVYENVEPDTWGSDAELILTVNGSAKVLRTADSFSDGESVLWTGNANASEWLTAGVLQDLFKNLLLDWMDEDNADWIEVPTTPQSAPSGGSALLTVRLNGAYPGLSATAVERSILLVGNGAGTPDVLIPLRAVVQSRHLTVSTVSGVTDWRGEPLPGNGDAGSSIFQLIYAGPDGMIAPPEPNGAPGGDDIVLETALSRESFSRFGTGRELQPDFGLFLETFLLSRFAADNARVYIRAWDAGSFADSVAYGDSALYQIADQVDEIWEADAWTVDRVPGYPGDDLDALADHDGDSIPDGWNVAFLLDARRPIEPLVSGWTQLAAVGTRGSGDTQFNGPARLALSSNHVFVADMWNHRVQVFNRSLSTLVTTYGDSMGAGDGQLNQPTGLAYDRDHHRLVIADTGNHRVVVLTVDPATGALTPVTTFGSAGTGNGEFKSPYDIAFSPSGRILVADTLATGTGNHRLQLFSAAGDFVSAFGSQGSGVGELNRPLGVFGAPDGLFYVADTDNNRLQCFSGSGSSLWRFGTEGSGSTQFSWPYDMALDALGNLLVVDNRNHRLQLLDVSTFGAPALITSLGSYGTASGQLSHPQSVATDLTGGEAYVADTGNDRVLRMRLIVDGDGDGMDDYWELKHGLDWHDAADAMIDLDGDGVLTIGEYRLDTDPNLRDTNDDGLSDGWALAHAVDPLAAFPPHAGIAIRDAGIQYAGDVLTWSASAGVTYKIEMALDLTQPEWMVQDTITVSGDGMTSWTNAVPQLNNRYFYRIRQEL
jgi:DNA-binding beta-propeller fold protein YncE